MVVRGVFHAERGDCLRQRLAETNSYRFYTVGVMHENAHAAAYFFAEIEYQPALAVYGGNVAFVKTYLRRFFPEQRLLIIYFTIGNYYFFR